MVIIKAFYLFIANGSMQINPQNYIYIEPVVMVLLHEEVSLLLIHGSIAFMNGLIIYRIIVNI